MMIKKGYVDDGAGGGSKKDVERLMGEETEVDGKLYYSGTIAKILSIRGFTVKMMVRKGESRPHIVEKLGGGVLGLPWDPLNDVIRFHLGVNLSKKRGKIRTEDEITALNLEQIETTTMTRRVMVSQIYTIYDPLGLMSPITIRYKMLLQKMSSPEFGWDEELDKELSLESRKILIEMVKARDIVFPRSIIPPGSCGKLKIVGWFDGDPASGCVLYSLYDREMPTEGGEVHQLRLIAGKSRVTPSGKNAGRNSTPRSEMRGLLLASRLVTAVLPGLSELSVSISLFGDSQ
jgi:hypothetical protein